MVAIARIYKLEIVIHQKGQSVWTVTTENSKHSRQVHIAYHDWEHYSTIRKTNNDVEGPAFIQIQLGDSPEFNSKVDESSFSVEKDDVLLEFESDNELAKIVEPKIVKPLSGKEKKRLRKLKASERHVKKHAKDVVVPEIDVNEIQQLPNVLQKLNI